MGNGRRPREKASLTSERSLPTFADAMLALSPRDIQLLFDDLREISVGAGEAVEVSEAVSHPVVEVGTTTDLEEDLPQMACLMVLLMQMNGIAACTKRPQTEHK